MQFDNRSLYYPKGLLSIALLGIFIRLFFLFLGSRVIDGSSLFGGLHYSDIDYYVYCDGADNILQGKSPYEQPTYRYPPIFALLLTFNRLFNLPEFGKIIFSIADVMVGVEIYRILEMKALEKHAILNGCDKSDDIPNTVTTYSRFWCWIWMVNPISIMISTRGSSDSISNFLVLLLLRQAKKENYTTAGILLGLAIHLRIYPIIFLPSLLYHILFDRCICQRNRDPSIAQAEEDHISFVSYYYSIFSSRNCFRCVYFLLTTLGSLSLATAISYHYYGAEYLQQSIFYHCFREDHRHNFSLHFYWIYLRKIKEVILSSSLPLSVTQSPSPVENFYSSSNSSSWICSANSNTSSVNFFCQLGNYIISTAFFESLFLRIGLFLPQILLFASIIVTFASKNLEACFLLQTMVFVTYNKVVTAQYFSWYLCLLPVAIGEVFDNTSDTSDVHVDGHSDDNTHMDMMESNSSTSRYNSLKRYVFSPDVALCGSLLFWLCALSLWLYRAYQLEFMGRNLFFELWQCSVLFHFANALCIGIIIFIAHT